MGKPYFVSRFLHCGFSPKILEATCAHIHHTHRNINKSYALLESFTPPIRVFFYKTDAVDKKYMPTTPFFSLSSLERFVVSFILSLYYYYYYYYKSKGGTAGNVHPLCLRITLADLCPTSTHSASGFRIKSPLMNPPEKASPAPLESTMLSCAMR